jgi:hypothetical protein
VEQLAPDQAVGFEGLEGTPARPSDDLRAAERMFNRLVAYVDRGGPRSSLGPDAAR